ncbi:OmpH family outer membrane protein [Capnocytophaga canimorsus]|uniref:OmpH family outer membrane protein n=1 Tax=Capnocytophaga canimorsus TaxID=28188 RepID=UPI001AD385A1|nr:OmpH family outer membrane protein [Capnocytophaga canimorsus]GIM58425.1 hypothetical protein CAPN007_06320 [Capnocytophaga canimorsus]
MKKQVIHSVVFLLLATTGLFAQKNVRIGYVDMDFILENVEEYKIASAQFAQQVEQWEAEIEKRKTKIEAEKNKLKAEKPLLTPELIKDREQEIAILEHNLRVYQQEKFGAENGEYVKQKFMLAKPIQDQVFNAVQEIGKLKKYDFIFEKSDVSMLYSNNQHNLSRLILRVINKKESAEDRNKSMAELLKENYDFEVVDEKAQRKAEIEQARQQRAQEREKQREAARQQRLQEREQKKKEAEERKKKLEEQKINK